MNQETAKRDCITAPAEVDQRKILRKLMTYSIGGKGITQEFFELLQTSRNLLGHYESLDPRIQEEFPRPKVENRIQTLSNYLE